MVHAGSMEYEALEQVFLKIKQNLWIKPISVNVLLLESLLNRLPRRLLFFNIVEQLYSIAHYLINLGSVICSQRSI